MHRLSACPSVPCNWCLVTIHVPPYHRVRELPKRPVPIDAFPAGSVRQPNRLRAGMAPAVRVRCCIVRDRAHCVCAAAAALQEAAERVAEEGRNRNFAVRLFAMDDYDKAGLPDEVWCTLGFATCCSGPNPRLRAACSLSSCLSHPRRVTGTRRTTWLRSGASCCAPRCLVTF